LKVLLVCQQEKKQRAEEGPNLKDAQEPDGDKEERVITIRPLNMADFKEAKNQAFSLSLSV